MKWITNCDRDDAIEYIRTIKFGQPQRRIVVREPKAAETYPAGDPSKMGTVGLYDEEQP